MQSNNETSDIEILFEDEYYLVIDKPAGLMVHGDGRSEEMTLADWVVETYPEMRQVGEPWSHEDGTTIARPGIVHRLDRDTSGVMVLTKTQESFEHLKEQFQSRTIEKAYKAFVYGTPKEKEGVIDRAIGKSAKDFRLWSAQRGARGKLREAVTEYRVLEESKEASFLEIRPKTGRTHQIRVHMKAINHPVVCDDRYAPKQQCILGFNRLALHAYSIGFERFDGTQQECKAPLPEDFNRALKKLL